MVSKFSLFMATAQYNFLRFIPGKKQQFFEYLEELSENVQTDFFCQDILEVWLENFGIGGLVLGSAALFSIGFILMVAADIIIWRTGSTVVTSLVRICSGLYCFEKFRGSSKRGIQDFLILLYIGTCLLSGFHWVVTILFLIVFINGAAYAARGGHLC